MSAAITLAAAELEVFFPIAGDYEVCADDAAIAVVHAVAGECAFSDDDASPCATSFTVK